LLNERKRFAEAMLKVFLTVFQKTLSGGATREDLREAYREVTGRTPSNRSLQRIIKRINEAFDAEEGQGVSPADGDEFAGEPETGSGVIERRREGRQVCYVLGGGARISGEDVSDAQIVLLSLFPQLRSALKHNLEQILQSTLQGYLSGISSFTMLFSEMDRYVHVSGPEPTDPKKSAFIIREILQAIREKKRVFIRYRRTYDGRTTERKVEPMALLYRFNQWYLLGRYPGKKEYRLFLLDQIEDIQLTNINFQYSPGFSLQEVYRHSWSVWTEEEPGEPETVRLKVRKGPSMRFRALKFHHTQKVRKLQDGSLEVTYKIIGARSMIPWLMSWGTAVEVLEPAWLREEMAGALTRTREIYG